MIIRLGTLAFLLVAISSAGALRNAGYEAKADETTKEVADEDVAREIEIARYYLGKRNYVALIKRCKILVTQHSSSTYAAEALSLLVEAYVQLGIRPEAQTAAAVLQRKFPDSHWASIAQQMLQAAGLRAAEDDRSWISRAFQ